VTREENDDDSQDYVGDFNDNDSSKSADQLQADANKKKVNLLKTTILQ